MDNVAGFIQHKFDHSVAGDDWGGTGTCTSSCYAAADDECPNQAAAAPLFSVSPAPPPRATEVMSEKIDKLEQEAKATREAVDKIDKLEQEAKAMRETVGRLEQPVGGPPRTSSPRAAEATSERIDRLEREAKAMRETIDRLRQEARATQERLEALPEPRRTSMVVVVSVLCAVMVQVIAAVLPFGRPAAARQGPYPSGSREPLLLGQ